MSNFKYCELSITNYSELHVAIYLFAILDLVFTQCLQYTKLKCVSMCLDMDECAEDFSCPDNFQCINVEGNYSCICDNGFFLGQDNLTCGKLQATV